MDDAGSAAPLAAAPQPHDAVHDIILPAFRFLRAGASAGDGAGVQGDMVTDMSVYLVVVIVIVAVFGGLFYCFGSYIKTAARFLWTYLLYPFFISFYYVVLWPLFTTGKFVLTNLCRCGHHTWDTFDYSYNPWKKMPVE